MPATFQKTFDKTLEGVQSKFAFLDDILVRTKGFIKDHEQELDKFLQKLDAEGLAIGLQNCELAKNTIEWLGFTRTPTGITPLVTKTEAIMNLDNPKNTQAAPLVPRECTPPNQVHPELAELSEPFLQLLNKNTTTKNNKINWKEEHTSAFNKKKQYIK